MYKLKLIYNGDGGSFGYMYDIKTIKQYICDHITNVYKMYTNLYLDCKY